MVGKSQRDKGMRFQAELAKRWRDSGLFPHAKSSALGQAGSVGREPSDILGVPFVIECKRQKRPNIKAALEQAEAGRGEGDGGAIAVCRWDGQSEDDAIVAMRLADWEQLVGDKAGAIRERARAALNSLIPSGFVLFPARLSETDAEPELNGHGRDE